MKKVLTAIGAVAVLTLLSIVFFGASTLGKAKQYGPHIEAAVDDFYGRLEREEYAAVYEEIAGRKFRDTSTLEDFSVMMYNVRNKLGSVRGRDKGLWKIYSGSGGTYFYVQYNVHRDHGDALESFTFKKDGEDWRLEGYNVNSPELLK